MIKNYRFDEKFFPIPKQPYSTIRYMFVLTDLLHSRKILYTRGAIDNNYIMPVVFDNYNNMKLYYDYLNINNELTIHDTLVYGVPNQYPDNTDFDYILYAFHNGSWWMFNAELIDSVLFRIPDRKRSKVRYFFNKLGRVHTLVLYYNNQIIAVIAGLLTESDYIPDYLKNRGE